MILYISSLNRSKLYFDFVPRGAVGAEKQLEAVFRFRSKVRCWGAPFAIYKSVHSLQFLCDWAETWWNDTRFQSAQYCEAEFLDFSPKDTKRRLLRFSNRFTAYSSDAIEMKLGRMILGISPHNRSESDFPVSSPEGAVWARLSKFLIRNIYPKNFGTYMMMLSYRSAQSVWAGYFRWREGLSFKIFWTSFVHVLLSRRRRILDLKDDRSVRSALFWNLRILSFIEWYWTDVWSIKYFFDFQSLLRNEITDENASRIILYIFL